MMIYVLVKYMRWTADMKEKWRLFYLLIADGYLLLAVKSLHSIPAQTFVSVSVAVGVRRNISRGQRRHYAYPF